MEDDDDAAYDLRRLACMLVEMRSRVYPLFPLGDHPSVSTIAPWHVLASVRTLLHTYEPVIDHYAQVNTHRTKRSKE